jgi:hypothetical protein
MRNSRTSFYWQIIAILFVTFAISAICQAQYPTGQAQYQNGQQSYAASQTCAAVITGTRSSDTSTFWYFSAVWSRQTEEDAKQAARTSFKDTIHQADIGFGPYIKSTCLYSHGAVAGVLRSDDYGNLMPVSAGELTITSTFSDTTANAISNAITECAQYTKSASTQCRLLSQW